MSQDWRIEWVGDKTNQWQSRHGQMIDYYIGVGGWEGSMKLTQKPETPAPQVGQTLYGAVQVEVITPKDGGEPFEVAKFKKERRPDGPQKVSTPRATNGVVPEKADSKPADWWYQKDRRISRAGIMQAVIGSMAFDEFPGSNQDYVEQVSALTDALLADLDKCTPHPDDAPKASGQTQFTSAPVNPPTPVDPAEAEALIERCKALDPSRWLLELVGAGANDITKPEEAIRNLTAAQASVFGAKLDDLIDEAKVTVPAEVIPDDEEIEF